MDRAQKLRLILEVASVVAVVVSLVFVGIEVRQASAETALNTTATRIAAYQDLITQITDLNHLVITDPDWAAMQTGIFRPPETLTDPVEQAIYTSYFFLLFRHGDMAFYQFENGLLSRDRLESAVSPLSGRLPAPLVQEFWARYKGNFVRSYQNFIDSIIGQ